MDFNAKKVTLPEPKCVKAKFLLQLPELQPGCHEVPLRTVQEVRGCAQFWSVAQPAISPELPAIDRMMTRAQGKGNRIDPVGTPEEVAEAWDEWHQTLELFRVMFETPELWSATFQASFSNMLTPRERMALPSQRDKIRWTGGDATKEVIGAVDWTGGDHKEPAYLVADAKELLRQMEGIPGSHNSEEGWIIAVVELLALVAMAATQADKWAGELVFLCDRQFKRQSLDQEQEAKEPDRQTPHPLARTTGG